MSGQNPYAKDVYVPSWDERPKTTLGTPFGDAVLVRAEVTASGTEVRVVQLDNGATAHLPVGAPAGVSTPMGDGVLLRTEEHGAGPVRVVRLDNGAMAYVTLGTDRGAGADAHADEAKEQGQAAQDGTYAAKDRATNKTLRKAVLKAFTEYA